MRTRTFLCAGDAERGRLLDINRRLLRVEQLGIVLFAVAAAIAIPRFGGAMLLPIAATGVAFHGVQSRLGRYSRPELALAGMWLFSQAMILAAVALARGPREYLLPVFAFPLVLASVIFPRRVVVVAGAITTALIVTSGFVFDAGAVMAMPPILLCASVTVVVLALTGSAVRDLDVAARDTAIVDSLTGLLNRTALMARVAELEHQAAAGDARVALIVADVDRFKTINDTLGHAAGDAVLKEIAYRMRTSLGAFEPIYRFGGEEFVVILADTDAAAACALAERLRRAVGGEPACGVSITISCGVSATSSDETFDFDATFRRADAALYVAKRGGRDRVCAADAQMERRAAPARRSTDHPLVPVPGRHDPRSVDHGKDQLRSWLTISQPQREHMIAMSRRLRTNFRRAALLSGGSIVASTPWVGWHQLIPPAIAGAIFNVIQSVAPRLRRPEYALGAGWLLFQISIAVGFALAEHRPLFALPLLILMVIGSGAMFPVREAVVGVVLTGLLMAATAFHMSAAAVLHDPASLAFPLAMLGGVGLIGVAVQQSAVYHRGTRVVDQLTGLLNRGALDARIAELAHQSRLTGERVSVVVGDIDRFKAVNDSFGHAAGDAVLKEVADRIRRHVRAFEAVYRFGGDELTLLLAGVGPETAAELAERLRDAVDERPVWGHAVTMSFGVAGSAPGENFDYADVFRRADSALYAAKRAGRDRVRVDDRAALETVVA